jgi:hypothetical protein
MRVYGPNGTTNIAPSQTARRTRSSAFSLDAEEPARATGSATAPRLVGGIDSLIALQELEDATERRKRAVKHGRRALDALDALKLALLSGTLDTAALTALKASAAGLAERTGDPGLDGVLAEIELRVGVELAKIGMPPAA